MEQEGGHIDKGQGGYEFPEKPSLFFPLSTVFS
jgi:hypothetical protein